MGTPVAGAVAPHGPAKDARVQANIRKVPAHVRSNHQTRGTTEPGKISAGIVT